MKQKLTALQQQYAQDETDRQARFIDCLRKDKIALDTYQDFIGDIREQVLTDRQETLFNELFID